MLICILLIVAIIGLVVFVPIIKKEKKYKVVKEVDKFKNKTTITMNKPYKLTSNAGILSHGAKLGVRYLSSPDTDSILIDYYYEATEDVHDFLYLDGGDIIFRINDMENLSLPFFLEGERSMSSYEDNNGREHTTRTEYNFVEIDKVTLKKLCDAKTLEIKVDGRNSKEYNEKKCQGFIKYCKLFYGALYQ